MTTPEPTAAERDEPAADRIADAVLVRHATEADIARQVLILGEDPKILGMWADTCNPRPVTVADHFRALAEKLSRPSARRRHLEEAVVSDEMLRYFESRGRQRVDAVNRALATLRPYERRLVREAAVMGYVRGAMAGRSRARRGDPADGDIPKDSEMLTEVIDACIAMGELYPYLAAASDGQRRRVTTQEAS